MLFNLPTSLQRTVIPLKQNQNQDKPMITKVLHPNVGSAAHGIMFVLVPFRNINARFANALVTKTVSATLIAKTAIKSALPRSPSMLVGQIA